MREKELRLALICYGGISLAVYMHGITKEVWRLARASRDVHDGEAAPAGGTQAVYQELLLALEAASNVRLRVFADIIAGSSAGGINGIFLAQAMATGQSLEPLTDLWLTRADVEQLIDPDARPFSRFTKFWAVPIAWLATKKRGNMIDATVEKSGQDEVRKKLSGFVRARWFEPPFGGRVFSGLLLDAFDAMAKSDRGKPLVPKGQPVDLIVTVTDFVGFAQHLTLNSPSSVTETEHRLTLNFRHDGGVGGTLADVESLVVAARATASFPGAFPPFTLREFDAELAARGREWPGRAAFVTRQLMPGSDQNNADDRVLIDGSVLANAPFKPAIAVLKQRPARREVDRRFVYIDPKPEYRTFSFGRPTTDGRRAGPGFFATILGALSELPRSQPIRDNIDALSGMSMRIRRMRHIVDAMQTEVEDDVTALFGRTFFLDQPTPARLAGWSKKAQVAAAARAGYAHAAYGHLKLSQIVEDLAATAARLHGAMDDAARETWRTTLWTEARARGLDRIGAAKGKGTSAHVIAFFRAHDLSYRIRRLRFLARQLDTAIEAHLTEGDPAVDALHETIFAALGLFFEREPDAFLHANAGGAIPVDAGAFIDWVGRARDLIALDTLVERRLAAALAALPRAHRRIMLLAFLGFPFYDVATLPLLEGEGHDEYDPIKVDRISPSDAVAIRHGGARETLKGTQFNAFGAFFSRAYRENDYLWGRLHGADRLADIVASAIGGGAMLPPAELMAIKNRLFHAILDEEAARLPHVAPLIAQLRVEIGRR